MPTLPGASVRVVAAGAALFLAGCSGTQYRTAAPEAVRDAAGWYQFGDQAFQGSVANGRPNGEGVLRYRDGITVRGTFANGIPVGEATVTVPGWGEVKGRMENGTMVRGAGQLQDGTRFSGGLRNWRLEGSARLVTPRNEVMQGTFSGGRLNGEGIVLDANGTRTEGRFRDGRPVGDAFVSGPAGPALRTFDQNGNDRTSQATAERAFDREIARERAEVQRRAQDEARERARVDALKERHDRLTIDPERNPAFKKQCFCWDGFCLTVTSPEDEERLRRRTEAEKRAAEEREAARYRACKAWIEEFKDPSRPARAEAMLREIQAQSAAFQAVLQARVDAERRARALEAQRREAAVAAYQQSVRDEIARVEAENRAAAARRESEHKNRCANSASYRACFCPGPKGASCQ